MDTNGNSDRFRTAARHAFDSGWEACEAFRSIPDTKVESKIVVTGDVAEVVARAVCDAQEPAPAARKIPARTLDILKEQPPTPVPHHWYRNRTARFLSAIGEVES